MTEGETPKRLHWKVVIRWMPFGFTLIPRFGARHSKSIRWLWLIVNFDWWREAE